MAINKVNAMNEPEDDGTQQAADANTESAPELARDDASQEISDPEMESDTDFESKIDKNDTAPFVENPFINVAEAAKTQPITTKPTEPTVGDEPAIQVAFHCHVGRHRERNEDSCFSFVSEVGGHFKMQPFGLFVVADGMGGHADGHIASKIASRTAAHHIIDRLYLPLLQDNEKVMQTPIQEVLETAVQLSNKAVYDYEPEMDSGTTLTIALLLGHRLHVAHVGDSRLYMYANDKLERVTSDHSLVQRLQDVGQLTEEEATFYRYGHILLRAVGQSDEVEADTYMRLLPKSGILLLCSDGVSGFISDAEITEILSQDASVEKMADSVFAAAMSVGGFDNITAIVVSFKL
ncbi:MAG: hypothetical protein CSA11_07650 [Chloroflexi bacterium]|nr:MAG: hypothetical protein CSB13_02995 [Chloroflexota bacterium]PIE80466.1 MAG: hypothetical protein CSA11_07650 [Chloroflexota bacterium]